MRTARPARQVLLGLADGVLTVVEDAGGQGRAGARLGQDGSQVLGIARAAARPPPGSSTASTTARVISRS